MAKDAVTRTFSIGAICSGTEASEDFPTARRVRALLWATGSARSLGGSLGSDFQTSRESIYPNILTPESIPQFTIPTLSVQSSLRSLDKETEEEEADSGEGLGSSGTKPESSVSPSSTSSSGFSVVVSGRRAERSVSDPFTRRVVSHPCSYAEAQHCLDPGSKAALSLPHLAKVTTPYGFITLSQSPQMASEGALLYQAGLRRLNKDEETACGLKDKRRVTEDSTVSQNKETSVKGETDASPTSRISVTVSSPPPMPRKPDGKHKHRFYQVIRKHFTSCHKD